jgi:chemosensory pili system protein ChpA (sensor histidine kinase/response regulator)
MDDVRDFGALSWLRGEIDKSLTEARGALETFFEKPGEPEGLSSVVGALQQVRGALQMAELSGPVALAQEMELLAGAMRADEGARRPETFDALIRAILVLPNYLEWVEGHQQDLPLALLSLINEIRGMRGVPAVEARDLFRPDLSAEPPDWMAPADSSLSKAEAARLRPLYEAGLVEWLRARAPRHGLTVMAQTADRLKRSSSRSESSRFWWLVGAAVEAQADDALAAGADIKRLLGRVDLLIKTLAEQGEPGLAATVNDSILKELLYVVAQAVREGPRVRSVKDAFHLAEAWPPTEIIDRVRQELAVPASSLFQGVLPALQEDMATIKDALDVLARQGTWPGTDLAPVVARLRRVGDTLQMLGLAEPSRALGEQADRVAAVAAGDAPADGLRLADVAGALLTAEATFKQAARGGAPGAAGAVEAEERDLASIVMRQAKADMAQVMEAIEEYTLDRARATVLPAAASSLRQISGALSMLGLSRPIAAFGVCGRFLEQVLIPRGERVDAALLELFADSLAGLAEYLGAVEQGQDVRGAAWLVQVEQRLVILDARVEASGMVAAEAVELPPPAALPGEERRDLGETEELPAVKEDEALGPSAEGAVAPGVAEPVVGADEQAAAERPVGTVMLGGVDPEVAEVFLEEAGGEISSIGEHLQRWRQRPDDAESLKTLRRSFHTLKGSGRMVGASVLGEFSWAFENLLNRVIDGTVKPGPEMFALLDESAGALDQLLAELKGGPAPRADVKALGERADAMSAGLVSPLALAQPEVAVSEPEPVPAVPLPEETTPGAETVPRADEPPVTPEETSVTEPLGEELPEFTRPDAAIERPSDQEVPALPEAAPVEEPEAQERVAPQAEEEAIAPVGTATGAEAQGPTVEPRAEAVAEEPRPTEEVHPEDEIPASGAVVELDPELAAIFFQEATELLDGNETTLQHWREEPEQVRWRGALQRSLHTLKGSARMAGVSALGDLAHALESVLAAALERRIPTGPGLFDLLQSGNDRLAAMLDSLRSRTPVTAATDFLEHLEWVLAYPQELGRSDAGVQEAMAEQPERARAAEAGPSEELLSDEERALRALFLDEGAPLVSAAGEGLAAWESAPGELTRLDPVRDALRALKSGAAVSRLSAVERVTAELMAAVEAIQAQRVEVGAETAESLRAGIDLVGENLERIRNGAAPLPADEAVGELRRWTGTASLMAAAIPQGEPTAEVLPFPAKEEPAAGARPQYEQVRVRADRLDRLVNLAGEVSIYRSRLEQQVAGFHQAIDEFQQTSERLGEQLRRLSIETEAQLLFRHQEGVGQDYAVFDPLELDRYSLVQQLSRSLNESVSDLDNIRSVIDNLTRDAEMLLVQQGRAHTELQEGLVHTRMLPFAVLVPRLNRIARQIGTELGKQAQLHVRGGENELDRAVLDKMVAPLEHVLRNALDHGIESAETRRGRGKPVRGVIDLQVSRRGTDVIIQIDDDGGGVDIQAVRRKAVENGLITSDTDLAEEEVLQLILESGFSTAARVSQISGRGVGLDVVDATVKQLGGTLSIRSVRGQGTTFLVRLPLMLSITQALIVQAGRDVYAVPLGQVQAVMQARHEDLARYYRSDTPTVKYAGSTYQFMHLSTLLGGAPPELPGLGKKLPLLLMRSGENQVALQIEAVIGRREIVVKSLGAQLSGVRGLLGGTILGDGRPALILDGGTVIRRGLAMRRAARGAAEAPAKAPQAVTVMVVDDSITMRKVTARLLERHRMRVLTAADGVDALEQLQEQRPDVMILDIEMPRMDGYELARHMRHNPDLKDIPIVMVTSRIGEKHRQHAMELGVDRYLGKPYQESDLIENVRAVLQGRR